MGRGRGGGAGAGSGSGGLAASAGGSGSGGGAVMITEPGGMCSRSLGQSGFSRGSANVMRSPSRSGAISMGSPLTKVPVWLALSVTYSPVSSQVTLMCAELMSLGPRRRLARRPEPAMTDRSFSRGKISPSVGPPTTMSAGPSGSDGVSAISLPEILLCARPPGDASLQKRRGAHPCRFSRRSPRRPGPAARCARPSRPPPSAGGGGS